MHQDGSRQFQTLALVELAAFEEDTEVLKDRRELTGLNRGSLEHLNRLRSTEDAPGRVCSDLGGTGEVARLEQLRELTLVEVVGTGKVASRRETNREVDVVERRENVGNHDLFIDRDAQNLTLAVDSDDTARRLVFAGDKHCLARDAVHVEACARLEVVKVDETVFRDEVDDTVALRDLHRDGEIVRGLGREEDVDRFLRVHRVGGSVIDLDDVELSTQEIVRNRSEDRVKFGLTLAPEAVRTAKANNLVSSGAPSSLNSAKLAA